MRFQKHGQGKVFGRQRSHPIAELSSNHLVIKGGLCRCCGNHDTLELIIGDGFQQNFVFAADERVIIHTSFFRNELDNIF